MESLWGPSVLILGVAPLETGEALHDGRDFGEAQAVRLRTSPVVQSGPKAGRRRGGLRRHRRRRAARLVS
jgi:hypothetical protein